MLLPGFTILRPDPEYTPWLGRPWSVKDHVPHLVAPGVNGWSEIAPDYNITFDRYLVLSVAAGRKSGALGVMNTILSYYVQMLKRPGMAWGLRTVLRAPGAQHGQRFTSFPAPPPYRTPPRSASVAKSVASALRQIRPIVKPLSKRSWVRTPT